mmetsp:Transcript_16008/g.37954  ORF Transcript_16008/g.37954 Transcript_16008/m.37954 type:complete len:104 (-) Transcript_16008:457-768(-)
MEASAVVTWQEGHWLRSLSCGCASVRIVCFSDSSEVHVAKTQLPCSYVLPVGSSRDGGRHAKFVSKVQSEAEIFLLQIDLEVGIVFSFHHQLAFGCTKSIAHR